MKTKHRCICVVLMNLWGGIALAAQPGGDPLQSLLVSPEVLIHHRAEIGLTDDQVEQIRTRLDQAGREVQEFQQRANDAIGRLAELLAADSVDEEAAVKLLDEVLAVEIDQRRQQLRFMIQMRNELSAQQRLAAAQIARTVTPHEGLEQRLKAKLARIEREMQSQGAAGRLPLDTVGWMQKFPELMQNGQIPEAEALLDRVITTLGVNQAEDGDNEPRPEPPQGLIAEKLQQLQGRARQLQESGRDVSEIQKRIQQVDRFMQQGQTNDAQQLIEQAWTLMQEESTGNQTTGPENEPWKGPPKAPLHAPPPERSGRGLSAADALDEFYRPDEVQSIHLRVAHENVQRMLEALPERIYVPASFRWRDISVDNVALRFKGNSSSGPNQRHKRSFLVKFNKEDKDQRFFGLRLVSFDNGIQFGSLFSEPIITEILRDQGIRTHRCNYARVYLNDEYQGIYVNVERIDESFIENHLAGAEGSLFKVDEGGPGANLQFLGDDPSAYEQAFEAENKSAKKERFRLVELIKLINQSETGEFAANLESKMELDDFLRVTAVMLLSGAFDQLTGGSPHNYYLFHDANQDRWRYLPWDLDVGFCETAFGRIEVVADWNAAWPVPIGGPPSPLLERIVADPILLPRYRRAAGEILDKYFEPDRLCRIIDAKYELIRSDLQADPFPHQRATVPGDRSYDDIVESMKGFAGKRYASALQQLDNPGPRPEIVRRPPGNQPGHPPFGLPPQLVGKIQLIEQRVRQMQQQGQDISPIHQVMQRVGPLLQQGKSAEAESFINEVLKLISEMTSEPHKEFSRE